MRFEQNLRELRKQYGMSQEEFAERLDVTRQSVSKWENGSAYPELDKLLVICELFHCTLDDLLKGDLKERSGVDKDVYERHHLLMAKLTSASIAMILIGLSVYSFVEPRFVGKDDTLLNVLFLSFVLLAVLGLMYTGMQKTSFHRKYPQVPKGIYSVQESDHFEQQFSLFTVIGVGCIIAGVIIQMLLDSVSTSAIANGCFLLMIAIGVACMVYAGMKRSMVNQTLEEEHAESYEQTSKSPKSAIYCGVMMLLATALFLISGFCFELWDKAWIVFPVSGILCGIVALLMRDQSER